MPSVANVITFKKAINLQHAENAVAQLAEPPGSLKMTQIDFSATRHIDVTAGWRLGNALRRHGNESLLEVIIPDWDIRTTPEWFKQFTRSGLGNAIAFHCDRVLKGPENVSEQLREYYEGIRMKGGPNHLYFPGILTRRPLNVDNFDSFFSYFRPKLRYVGIKETAYQVEDLQNLATLAFESVQNVYDHSHARPLEPGTRVLDYLCMNFFQAINPPKDPTNRLSDYIRTLQASLSESQKLAGFLELIVSDDGVGIAARQSQNFGIYWDPDARQEEKALLEAMEKGGSVKFITQDSSIRHDPGYGIAKILASLRRLKAFAFLRTGRRLAFFDSLREAEAFALTSDVLGYMPGTTLDVLVPVPDPQLRLPGMK